MRSTTAAVTVMVMVVVPTAGPTEAGAQERGSGNFFFETGDVSHRVVNAAPAPCTHLLFEILPLDAKGPSLIPPRDRKAP